MQVSPASTAVGLTKFVPGAEKGEPDKFYPSGDRTFARVVPGRRRAGLGGRALDAAASAPARVFVLGDKTLEGDGLAELYRVAAERRGPAGRGPGPDGPARRGLPRPRRATSPRTHPDAVYFGGGADSNAVRLWRDLHDAAARARC